MADKSKLAKALINYVEMPGRQLNAFFGAKPSANSLAAARALKQVGGDILGSVQSAYTAPGRALSGQLDPNSPEGMQEAMNFALNMGAGGLGATTLKPVQGGAGTHGMFVGPKGMDNLGLQDALIEARRLKEQRVPDEQIWQRTAEMAAEKGVPGGGITFQFGGKPQFELSDDLAKVNPMAKEDFNYYPLSQVMEHPYLYQAEPKLKSKAVSPIDEEYSYYKDRENLLGIGNPHRTTTGYNDEFGNYIEQYNFQPDVLGHEINHALQFEHNLPHGGNQHSQKYLNAVFEQQKEKYSPNFERIEAAKPRLDNLYKLDSIQDFDRALNKRSYVPSDLHRRGDYYKYSHEIQRELGPMPKRAGLERTEYIRNAHQILFDKYKQEKGITQADIEYALSQKPSSTKYQIKKMWKQLEPDYEAQREFAKLRDKNYEINQLNPFEVYDRLTGEATSRLVQDRWNMTPEQRAANYPTPLTTGGKKQIKPWELIDVYYD